MKVARYLFMKLPLPVFWGANKEDKIILLTLNNELLKLMHGLILV